MPSQPILSNPSFLPDPGALTGRSLLDLFGTTVHPKSHSAIILAGVTVGIIAGVAFTSFCIHEIVVEYCRAKQNKDVEAQEARCTPNVGEFKGATSGFNGPGSTLEPSTNVGYSPSLKRWN
jgi:hypothetical protein